MRVGTTITVLRRQRIDLLGDRDDVLVVRQDHDLVGVDVLDGVEQFGRRRVQRLPAGHDALHAEVGEQLGQPVAAAHRHHRGRHPRQAGAGPRGHVLARHRSLAVGVLLGDLLEQIGHADLLRTTVEIERDLDGGADVVGVDVTVPEAVTADHDDRVADLAPPVLERVDAIVDEVEEVHDLVALLAHVELTVDTGRAVRDRHRAVRRTARHPRRARAAARRRRRAVPSRGTGGSRRRPRRRRRRP